MKYSLRPYPSYKPSGVPWLGDVPEHWETGRLKRHVTNVVDQVSEKYPGDAYIALEHVESGTGRIREAGPGTVFDSQVKRFRANDVLFGKLRPYLAKVARPRQDGVCVGEFLVLRPHTSVAKPVYLEQLLRSKPMIDAVAASTFGAKMPRADWQFVGGMEVALPPSPDQSAIVRYLAYMDRRIRKYIRAKQKLIALLNEQKQVIIHRAVTGQIDVRTGKPYPKYKPSGVPWLGDVPEHWDIRRLKGVMRAVDRRTATGAEILLSLRRDHGVVVYAEHFSRPAQSVSLVGFKLVRAGQVVVNRMQANNGLIFCSRLDGLVSPDYSVFDVLGSTDPQYLSSVLRTPTYRAHFRRAATGLGTGTAGFLRLYDDELLKTPLALPQPDQQSEIVEWVLTQTASAEASVASVQRQIDLLREYRTRLVADVVTGKLDVREAAASLPEEKEEVEEPELAEEDKGQVEELAEEVEVAGEEDGV